MGIQVTGKDITCKGSNGNEYMRTSDVLLGLYKDKAANTDENVIAYLDLLIEQFSR